MFEIKINKIIQEIKNGKQRGASKNINIKGITYWADVAIQKYEDLYQVHVSLIEEDKMISEEYDIYFTRSFHTIEQAFHCIETKSEFLLSDLTPVKGQLIFRSDNNEEK